MLMLMPRFFVAVSAAGRLVPEQQPDDDSDQDDEHHRKAPAKPSSAVAHHSRTAKIVVDHISTSVFFRVITGAGVYKSSEKGEQGS